VPDTQDVDGPIRDFISNFVVADDDAANVIRRELGKPGAKPWIVDQRLGRCREFIGDAGRGQWIFRGDKIMQANKV
jgi:hypothetical protein